MDIKQIKMELCDINSKRRIHEAKKYEKEIREHFKSRYELSLLVKILCEDLNYPFSYCGSEPKYEKGKMKKICNSFKLSDKSSCPICHKHFFDEKKSLNKIGSLKKYGTENPMQSEIVKERVKKTNNERYGVDWHLSSECVQEKVQRSRNIQKIENRYKIINEIIESKYELLTDIQTGDYLDEYEFKCLKCNEVFTRKMSNNYHDIRCNICEPTPKRSLEEILIKHFSDNNFKYNIIRNDRTVLDGKEIDIYIPELNLGLEINGNYWHSNLFLSKNYHQEKKLFALTKGINIINIFEDEIKNPVKFKKIINRLNYFLYSPEIQKISARKCHIREISSADSKLFLEENHNQGNINSSYNIGLFYDTTLVSVMTFGKPRFIKNCEYELYRFCSKSNYSVIGAGGKLFSYFEKQKNNPSIITYADLNWGSGNTYLNLGFTFLKYTVPDMFFYDSVNKVRISRYALQKHKIQKFLNNDETVEDYLSKNKILKNYGAGNAVYIKNMK